MLFKQTLYIFILFTFLLYPKHIIQVMVIVMQEWLLYVMLIKLKNSSAFGTYEGKYYGNYTMPNKCKCF